MRKLLCARTGFYLPCHTLGKQNFTVAFGKYGGLAGGVPARLV
jgi:hypothetical protein